MTRSINLHRPAGSCDACTFGADHEHGEAPTLYRFAVRYGDQWADEIEVLASTPEAAAVAATATADTMTYDLAGRSIEAVTR